jgi:hypothetical protein
MTEAEAVELRRQNHASKAAMVRMFGDVWLAVGRSPVDLEHLPIDQMAAQWPRLITELRSATATTQRWMALDLWMALGREPAEFADHFKAHGWAETWGLLMSEVGR